MNEELARLRGAGTYSLFLSNVIKPKNPQIRKGKITPQTDKNGKLSQFAYTDNYFSFIWQPYNKGFYLILENNTDNNVKIEWDEITYVNMEKSVDHVFHKGVKYNDKGKSQPPTVIPSQTKLQDYLMPSSLTTYNSGLNLWISANIISFKDSYNPYYVGKTVKMVFPISVKDMKLEYIFEFKTKWTWDYPEQHEDDKVVE